jgi:hypothetical protein
MGNMQNLPMKALLAWRGGRLPSKITLPRGKRLAGEGPFWRGRRSLGLLRAEEAEGNGVIWVIWEKWELWGKWELCGSWGKWELGGCRGM